VAPSGCCNTATIKSKTAVNEVAEAHEALDFLFANLTQLPMEPLWRTSSPPRPLTNSPIHKVVQESKVSRDVFQGLNEKLVAFQRSLLLFGLLIGPRGLFTRGVV
jgi:hypothetical protein